MNNSPAILIHPQAHYMEPGTVAFIPGWIILFIFILGIALICPKLFGKNDQKFPITPPLLAFTAGSLMPAFDDLFAFVFGPPFAHHSLFHSLMGASLTYVLFLIISTKPLAKYALFGNLTHITFNFYLDFTTLFFPFTYQEQGLSNLIHINTYWLKAIHYPIILLIFLFGTLKFFRQQKR